MVESALLPPRVMASVRVTLLMIEPGGIWAPTSNRINARRAKPLSVLPAKIESQAPELIAALQREEAWPHPVRDLQLCETHISWVFLTGDYVYKIKKPVDFSFLDYSTLERRKDFCEREVALNRRLAPDVYLGVAPLERPSTSSVMLPGILVGVSIKPTRGMTIRKKAK